MDIEKIKGALKGFNCEVISSNNDEAVIKVSNKTARLVDIPEGSSFRIGEFEFIKLEDFEDATTAVILKDFATKMEFGERNDYSKSEVRKYLNNDF